jgi:hypothetical protein
LARAVARVERLDERDGLGVGAGVEGRGARSRPRDEERMLAGGGDGGLVAAARLARVDGARFTLVLPVESAWLLQS